MSGDSDKDCDKDDDSGDDAAVDFLELIAAQTMPAGVEAYCVATNTLRIASGQPPLADDEANAQARPQPPKAADPEQQEPNPQ
ncbi:MAG: hypothetical protein WCD70_10130 [Alphaproteobacteria bacterium]